MAQGHSGNVGPDEEIRNLKEIVILEVDLRLDWIGLEHCVLSFTLGVYHNCYISCYDEP